MGTVFPEVKTELQSACYAPGKYSHSGGVFGGMRKAIPNRSKAK